MSRMLGEATMEQTCWLKRGRVLLLCPSLCRSFVLLLCLGLSWVRYVYSCVAFCHVLRRAVRCLIIERISNAACSMCTQINCSLNGMEDREAHLRCFFQVEPGDGLPWGKFLAPGSLARRRLARAIHHHVHHHHRGGRFELKVLKLEAKALILACRSFVSEICVRSNTSKIRMDIANLDW